MRRSRKIVKKFEVQACDGGWEIVYKDEACFYLCVGKLWSLERYSAKIYPSKDEAVLALSGLLTPARRPALGGTTRRP